MKQKMHPLAVDTNIKPLLITEQVAEILIKDIMNGVLKGGEQLVEIDLKNRFGISRTPLREAFRELEKNGFVDIIPRRGTYVKRLTRQDVEDVYDVRAPLEGLAAKQALKRRTPAFLQALEAALDGMERAYKDHDAKGFLNEHNNYHSIFIHASANPYLIDVLNKLRTLTNWHRIYFNFNVKDFERAFRVHQHIHSLFIAPDIESTEIEMVVKEHVLSGGAQLRQHLE